MGNKDSKNTANESSNNNISSNSSRISSKRSKRSEYALSVRDRQTIALKSTHGTSLVKSPSLDKLQVRSWLVKRGHLMRTWKRRYFVLTSQSIKYYKKELPTPPYGEILCGELSLRGAVVEFIKSSDKKALINIIGRSGEMDLLIRLSTVEDLVWISALEWTIRRCSRGYITLLRTNASLQYSNKDKKKYKENNCQDWLNNELQKFTTAISNLINERVVNMFVYQRDGTTPIVQFNLLLWSNAIVPDHICTYKLPTSSSPTYSYGIQYYPYNQEALNTTIKISVDDIIDVLERTHHSVHIVISTTCTNKMCSKQRHKIYSIETCHGHSLNIQACCIYDYNELILSIRNILLYISLRVPTEESSYSNIQELDNKLKDLPCVKAKLLTLSQL